MNEVRLGRYRHYKGKEYRVITVGLFESTLEPCVVYEALYETAENKIWIRTEKDFTAMVTVDGKETPRFTFLEA